MNFEEQTNLVFNIITRLVTNNYDPLTVTKDEIKDVGDWLMYVGQSHINNIKERITKN